jgi:hypothetical protein
MQNLPSQGNNNNDDFLPYNQNNNENNCDNGSFCGDSSLAGMNLFINHGT